MAEEKQSQRRVRVLSLDGGGVRGLVTLQFLLELEKKIKKCDPTQDIRSCFDMVCGTSTGGILAFALSATKLTLEEINHLYTILPSQVFTGLNWFKKVYVNIGSLLGSPDKYSPDSLEKFLDQTFGKDTKLADIGPKYPHLKSFVVSTNIETEQPDLFIFRSYKTTVSKERIQQVGGTTDDRGLQIPIRDALRATSAAPTYFPSIKVGNYGTFVDGGFLANNPVEIAVAEAFELWPERGVGTILSLGTGAARNKTGGSNRSNVAYAMTALELATDSQRASNRMAEVTHVIKQLTRNDIKNGLRHIDANNDGKISQEEFHRYLARFGLSDPVHLASIEDPTAMQDTDELLKSLETKFKDYPEYFRVNTPPELNLGEIQLDTTDDNVLKKMVAQTNEWLKQAEPQAQLERIAKRLCRADKSY